MKRTTVLPNGSTTTLEGTPAQMAEYDRELMRQMVQLMNEQDDSVESEEGGEHGAN